MNDLRPAAFERSGKPVPYPAAAQFTRPEADPSGAGARNLEYDRTTDRVKQNLLNAINPLAKGDRWRKPVDPDT